MEGVPHAFAHTVECCRAAQATTGWPTFLYSVRTATAHVVCPVSEREYDGFIDFVTPCQFSGFAGTAGSDEFRGCWRRFTQRKGAVAGYHALHPAFHSESYYDQEDCVTANNLYLLDLTPSADELLRRFDRSRRRELRDYDDRSKHLIVDREALTAFLVDTYPVFAARVGVSAANNFTPASLRAFATSPNVELVGTGTGGRVEAVFLFGFTPFVGECLLNVATLNGRQYSTLLLWYGILALKARGVPLLNLGGGVQPGDAIALAKERFGPRCVPFRSVREIYRPDIYQRLCREAGVAPGDDTGYFPAYRTRHH